MSGIPDEVRRLAAEREERRAAKEFAAADELRDRIAELGYQVLDGPSGSSLEPIEAATVERLRPADVPSALEDAPTADASVHWVCEGWPEDIVRALEGFRAAAGALEVQYVVADVTGEATDAFGGDVEVLSLMPDAGWAAARNAGLRRSGGALVLAVDEEVARLVGEAHDHANKVLSDHEGFLSRMAELLQVTEVIDGPDLKAMFDGQKPVPTPAEIDAMRANGSRPKVAANDGPDVILQPPPRPA